MKRNKMKEAVKISGMGRNAESRAAEQRARELLDLYFEGKTTLADEKFLTEFFSGGDIPTDLDYAKAMFAAFGAAHTCHLADKMPLMPSERAETVSTRIPKIRRIYMSVSVAAAMLLAAVVTWALMSEKPTVYCYLNGEPITDITVAARQADMASRLFESNIRASSDGAAAVNRAAESMQRINRILVRMNPEE